MAEALTSAENRYSGIPTMRRAMKAYHLPEPKFENGRDEFIVTFYNAMPDQEKVNENAAASGGTAQVGASSKDLLAFCQQPRTRQEIADYLGIKTVFYAISKYVQPLIDAGKIGMTLPDKPRSSKQKYFTK